MESKCAKLKLANEKMKKEVRVRTQPKFRVAFDMQEVASGVSVQFFKVIMYALNSCTG